MITNYVKIIWRTIRRKPVFSLINIVGLAIGLFCTMLLYLFLSNEFGYDVFFDKADHIVRGYTRVSLNSSESRLAKTPQPLGPALKQHFPEVENYTAIGYTTSHTIRNGEASFREYRVYTADSNFFKVFNFRLVSGTFNSAFTIPNQAVITQSTARRYFGNDDPVGKQLLVDDSINIAIAAVMEDFPEKSHFEADILLSDMGQHPESTDNWLGMGFVNYFLLKEGTDWKALEQKIKPLTDKHVDPFVKKMLGTSIQQFKTAGNDLQFHFQPLKQIYLYSKDTYNIDPNTEWGHTKTGSIVNIRIFMAVAIFVLIIAMVNFINLSTATSESRGKEVGIRKTLGSSRWSLVSQFMFEAIMFTALAVVVAIFLAGMALPWFNGLLNLSLSMTTFLSFRSVFFLIVFVLVTGLLAGTYPALFLSGFKPVETLKGGVKKQKASLRSVLVVTQFAISIALIIGMLTIRKQLDYLQQREMGFEKQHMLVVTNAAALNGNEQVFKQALSGDPIFKSVTVSSIMFEAGVPESAYSFEGSAGVESIQATSIDVDDNFDDVFNFQMLNGRFFDPSMLTDSQAVVVNEAAMYAFKAGNKLNQNIINLSNKEVQESFTIIGIVKDFHFESLHQRVKPLVMHLRKVSQPAMHIAIRYHAENEKQVISRVESAWKDAGASEKCNLAFLSDRLANLYQDEKKVSSLSAFLSVLAVFIACMGLFGLVMFIIEKRTKEIGIRKVLGASVSSITRQLSLDFLKLVFISFAIGIPVAWFEANQWLKNYPYRVALGWTMFALAALLVLGVALVTISFHAIKAALANPIKSLRTE